jgi:peptidoglycan/xylan/chitin deacetylase (PgdA/CDA1 family)
MSKWRLPLRCARAAILSATGGLWLAKRRLAARGAVVVLAFHRVLDDADMPRTNSLPGMVTRGRTFAALCAYVARNYLTVSVEHGLFGRTSWPMRLIFTFDDGWADTFTFAFPAASAEGIPLTVFICPGLMGKTGPFWPESVAAAIRVLVPAIHEKGIETSIEALKRAEQDRLRKARAICAGVQQGAVDSTMSWEQATAMSGAGAAIGSHTQSHQILTLASETEARFEAAESKDEIERKLKQPCTLFAYPNGSESKELRRAIAGAGYEFAFTTRRGAWTAESDPLAIPRINICEENVAGLRGEFSRAQFEFTVFWRAWRAMAARRE